MLFRRRVWFGRCALRNGETDQYQCLEEQQRHRLDRPIASYMAVKVGSGNDSADEEPEKRRARCSDAQQVMLVGRHADSDHVAAHIRDKHGRHAQVEERVERPADAATLMANHKPPLR